MKNREQLEQRCAEGSLEEQGTAVREKKQVVIRRTAGKWNKDSNKTERKNSMKKLYKSNMDKKLCGVCGGIAEYLNVDATIVRLIFVILGLWSGVGVIFYIIAALLIPDEM